MKKVHITFEVEDANITIEPMLEEEPEGKTIKPTQKYGGSTAFQRKTEDPNYPYPCPECPAAYKKPGFRDRHIRMVHHKEPEEVL